MTSNLRVAVIKPDWGIRGGFELVIEKVVGHLRRQHHDVTVLTVDAVQQSRRAYGRTIEDHEWARAPEFFSYLAQYESCRKVNTRRADLVISTQPPSFATDHPRHLSLFYHHRRIFYDLSTYAVAAGLVGDSSVHTAACQAVFELDDAALGNVGHVLSGSETVLDRLAFFHNRSRGVSLFHAGPAIERRDPVASGCDEPSVLCVSRHDFPKRTELFVHAMHLLGGVSGIAVGAGGRLGSIQCLDEQFTRNGAPEEIPAEDLWLNSTPWVEPRRGRVAASPITFLPDLPSEEVQRLMGGARCVVAPALLEDYGLTVIEAMQHGVPVVTCRDSGHLLAFVEHGVTGLVVDPNGRAIADAVQSLLGDPRWAQELGRAGRHRAEYYTWARAFKELDRGVEAAMS